MTDDELTAIRVRVDETARASGTSVAERDRAALLAFVDDLLSDLRMATENEAFERSLHA
jgi:hypothetical protein